MSVMNELLATRLPRPSAFGRLVVGWVFGAMLVACAGPTAAQDGPGAHQILIALDPDLGLRSGVETSIAANRGVIGLVDAVAGRTWFDEGSGARKAGAIGLRLGRYAFVDLPASYFMVVLAHEFIGHGGRYRELGIDGIDYGFDWPPPYGPGGGHASATIDGGVTEHEVMAMETGGLESHALMQRRLAQRWMIRDEFDYTDGLLLWWSFQIQMNYVMGTDESGEIAGYNDPQSYVRWLNTVAGYADEADWVWTIDDLKGLYVLNALNPFVAYSLFSQFEMLWNGGAPRSVPSIDIGSLAWLPALRVGLTPFGAEVHVENHLRVGDRYVFFDLARGDQAFHDGWGSLGLAATGIIQGSSFALDADARLWRQPDLLELDAANDPTARTFGGVLSLRGWLRLSEERPLSAVAEIGYKSRGFVEGYGMDAGPVLMLGLGLGR